jgi:HEAT repeat protein
MARIHEVGLFVATSLVVGAVIPGRIECLPQPARVASLSAALNAPEPESRGRAACDLREMGDAAAPAITPLVALLADGAPLDRKVCERTWWRGNQSDLTSPGELAASALVAIGSRAYPPVVTALKNPAWIARRNAAWALGAFDDERAVSALIEALRDPEAPVREQVAWALGALDANAAVPALMAALRDADARVRRQVAWALGAIGDRRAVDALIPALKDEDPGVRRQAAWAIGAIGR